VSCALTLHSAIAELGLPIRAGLHAGEIEIRQDDVAGIAVPVAARVAGLAGASQTLVSSTVKDLTTGSGFAFKDLGDQRLKGEDDPWRCYSLEPVSLRGCRSHLETPAAFARMWRTEHHHSPHSHKG
jgi:class 3 adenylate cyclase